MSEQREEDLLESTGYVYVELNTGSEVNKGNVLILILLTEINKFMPKPYMKIIHLKVNPCYILDTW